MKKSKASDLVESCALSESADISVDQASGVVKNVVLMTGNKVSKNRTKYLPSALKEAVSRYEGAKMYLDHPRRDELDNRRGNRSVRDIAGVFRSLRIQEGPEPKLVGDVHTMAHNRELVLGIAGNAPKGTGLSLRDRGVVREEKGITLVEGFEGDDFSVDLVTTASLNKGLFESKEGGEDQMDFKALTLEKLKEERPDLVESIESTAKASLAKALEEAGVKSLEAEKLVALSESAMSVEFKTAIKPAIMKKEVTLEEAKGIIASQVKLFETVGKGKKNSDDPVVTVPQKNGKPLTESKEGPTDADFEKAFK